MNVNILVLVNNDTDGQITALIDERNKHISKVVEIDKMIATLTTIRDIAKAHQDTQPSEEIPNVVQE